MCHPSARKIDTLALARFYRLAFACQGQAVLYTLPLPLSYGGDLHESGFLGPLLALKLIEISPHGGNSPEPLAAISAWPADAYRLDQPGLSKHIG